MAEDEVQSPRIDEASRFPTNPGIFKLGTRKQFCFPHVLAHEIGAGSLCRNCNCTGLDLHFWRKICKVCGCRMDEHDVQLPNQYDHGQIVVGRLFGAKEHFENAQSISSVLLRSTGTHERKGHGSSSSGSRTPPREEYNETHRAIPTAVYNFRIEDSDKENSKSPTEYAWVPVPDKVLVEKYMRALPEEERPIAGTIGEQNRKSRLQFQLPLYDCNVDDARFVTEKDKAALSKFVENVKKNVIGVGTVVEVDPSARRSTDDADDIEAKLRRALGDCDINGTSGGCKGCSKDIHKGDVGITTDHGPGDETFHPNCFRCAECDQLLVDIIYFYHEGKYYCGRHFADLQYPRCSGCDELIFANEYTFAEEKSWHFDHFACFKCDLKLGGHRYMMKDEQPHCIPCYMTHFAKSCEACQQKIGPDEKRLNYKEFHWHAAAECFQCCQCHKDLIGQKFIMKHPNLFCSSQCRADHSSKV